MIFGTPEYMSPEQAQGNPPDHRVDVYAVGCIMYQMLTGSVPFTADNFMGILTKHLLEAPVPPRKRRPDLEIPPDVEAVCLRAMEKDRDKRWPDMDSFYKALGQAGGMPFEPSQVFSPPRASLKYPDLAEPNAQARESRTALAVPGPQAGAQLRPTGSFEDERPGSRAAAGGGLAPTAKLGLAIGAALLAVLGLVFALRSSRAPKPAETAAAVSPAPPAMPAKVVTPTPAEPARPTNAAPVAPIPAQPSSATPMRTETAAETEPAAGGKPSHHRKRGDEPKADPLHRQIPVPAEPTPAELKNPFNTP